MRSPPPSKASTRSSPSSSCRSRSSSGRARRPGLKVVTEVFADRAYEDNGLLVSRRKPGAVLHDPEKVAERVQRMVEEQAITSVNGKVKKIAIDTVCIHGDTPAAVSLAKAVRQRLDQAKIKVASFSAAGRA